ncbi:alpha-ketoglutarate-dependent dioxygenase AlkB family protein [Leptolyngbya sp. AN03gr2]|uniref:alpha-ketoglutarate-dependent dioxygenase AlkB family protein n=1 Tax=unclassified Leptolyngbya TaxID=2650499 RepID=UPI003D31E8B2
MSNCSLIKQNGTVFLYENLFDQAEADQLYSELLTDIDWQQDHLKIYGKNVPLPRLTAWYGEKQYSYSGIEMQPRSWTESLLVIKSRIEPLSNIRFNSVLLNLYRDGNDSVSWHSDDEPELGKNPIIGSVSFGATRRFSFKHRYDRNLKKIDVELTHGSFLLMAEETQHYWLHQIPKTKKLTMPRINLTFRMIR